MGHPGGVRLLRSGRASAVRRVAVARLDRAAVLRARWTGRCIIAQAAALRLRCQGSCIASSERKSCIKLSQTDRLGGARMRRLPARRKQRVAAHNVISNKIKR
jgi:hypothetical protein